MPGIRDWVPPKPQLPTAPDMAGMTHAQLWTLRRQFPSQQHQQLIAPFEHRAFAREDVEDSPLRALPLAAMIPLYQAAKAMGKGSRTGTGGALEQMKQGYIGIGEGLRGAWDRFRE